MKEENVSPDPKHGHVMQPDGHWYDLRGKIVFKKFFTYICYYDKHWRVIWWPLSYNAAQLLLLRKQGPSFRKLIFLWWLFISLLVINIVLRLELL